MIGPRPNRRKAARRAAPCAIALSALLAPASLAASPNRTNLPGGCGPRPSWIESATLPEESQDALPSCFSSSSNQAEALLSIANNRPYAQLITLHGAEIEQTLSSFQDPLAARLTTGLSRLSSPKGSSTFLLGPEEHATLAIDRPAPGAAQAVDMTPAPANAFAVASLAWALLSAASKRLSLPAATQTCILAAVYGALQSPPHPERALWRMQACVNVSHLRMNAQKLLRGLAARLLRAPFFREVVHLQGAESHRARIAFLTSPSNPDLINPEIHLGPANLGTLPSGELTVRHLSASGGAPPYRFYLVPEPGGPGVPSWLKLAADGTLSIEPPVGSFTVALPVEVVDSNGEHSVVGY